VSFGPLRVREVERASFSPLVFAATGSMGPTATIVFRKLASILGSIVPASAYSGCVADFAFHC